MIGDLHCHTRLSDGSMSIDNLVFYAKRAGLDFVAITDHDTMEGVSRASVLGKRYGINVVPGVEISCFDYVRGRKVHLLCYLPEKPDRLQGLFNQILENRTKAGQKMIRLVTRYYPVTEEHIQRYAMGCKSIYKVHIMQALIDLGYDRCVYGELFHQLFDSQNGICFQKLSYPDVHEALELVHSAGGVAVLAHPTVFDSMDLLRELAEKGQLHGVEAYHPAADREAVAEMEALADTYGLIKTGGSDFHGMYDDHPTPLATCITLGSEIQVLYDSRNNRKK